MVLFLFGGFAFGNLPWIKEHFGLMTLLVIAVSLLPLLVVALKREWRAVSKTDARCDHDVTRGYAHRVDIRAASAEVCGRR